jgi:hypothetical protein
LESVRFLLVRVFAWFRVHARRRIVLHSNASTIWKRVFLFRLNLAWSLRQVNRCLVFLLLIKLIKYKSH